MTEKPNYDDKTGMHFGFISQHTPDQDASSCVFDGRDLTYEAALEEARGDIELCIEGGWLDEDGEFDEQKFTDNYEDDEPVYLYTSEDGYQIVNTSSGMNCFVVEKSPFFTHTKHCSPCCPNAGDLDAPQAGGLWTYCLGHDWFTGHTAPYPVWTVEEHTLIIPVHVEVKCDVCQGTGSYPVERIADMRNMGVKDLIQRIRDGVETGLHGFNEVLLTCHCSRCRGYGRITKMETKEIV